MMAGLLDSAVQRVQLSTKRQAIAEATQKLVIGDVEGHPIESAAVMGKLRKVALRGGRIRHRGPWAGGAPGTDRRIAVGTATAPRRDWTPSARKWGPT